MKNVIQVWEWEKLYYDDATPFTQQHWGALCRYQHQISQRSGFVPFQIIHKGIRFTSYVGVVQAGNLTIEILPKIDRASRAFRTAPSANKRLWQSALLQMLAACKWLPAHAAGAASLLLHQQSLLDVYLASFLQEVEKLLHEGLLRKYEQSESNQPTLKGRLLSGLQATKNSIHQERFYVSHAAYTADTILNRLLHQAVCLVRQVSDTASLQSHAANLLLQFPQLQSASVSEQTFAQLVFNRKTERYRPAIQFAEMLLRNISPGNTAGSVATLAILFDMNALWEEWVYRQLKKEETTFKITVQRQQCAPFWKPEFQSRAKTIRPDIVIGTTNGEPIILDTKWKLPENNMPDDDDLKQLFVYNLYWQSRLGVLLYPAEENATEQGHYLPLPQLGAEKRTCRMLLQSIFKDGKLDPDFGKRILESVLNE